MSKQAPVPSPTSTTTRGAATTMPLAMTTAKAINATSIVGGCELEEERETTSEAKERTKPQKGSFSPVIGQRPSPPRIFEALPDHAIDDSGLVVNLFKQLWGSQHIASPSRGLQIPSTIEFSHSGVPSGWYFTSRHKKMFMKRKNKRLTNDEIYRVFSQFRRRTTTNTTTPRAAGSNRQQSGKQQMGTSDEGRDEVVAIWRQQCVIQGEIRLKEKVLDLQGLKRFLETSGGRGGGGGMMDGSSGPGYGSGSSFSSAGILQQPILPSHHGFMRLFRATWTPHVCYIELLEKKCRMADRKKSLNEKFSFAGSQGGMRDVKVLLVSKDSYVGQHIDATCDFLVRALEVATDRVRGGSHRVTNATFNFAISDRDLYLLYASFLRMYDTQATERPPIVAPESPRPSGGWDGRKRRHRVRGKKRENGRLHGDCGEATRSQEKEWMGQGMELGEQRNTEKESWLNGKDGSRGRKRERNQKKNVQRWGLPGEEFDYDSYTEENYFSHPSSKRRSTLWKRKGAEGRTGIPLTSAAFSHHFDGNGGKKGPCLFFNASEMLIALSLVKSDMGWIMGENQEGDNRDDHGNSHANGKDKDEKRKEKGGCVVRLKDTVKQFLVISNHRLATSRIKQKKQATNITTTTTTAATNARGVCEVTIDLNSLIKYLSVVGIRIKNEQEVIAAFLRKVKSGIAITQEKEKSNGKPEQGKRKEETSEKRGSQQALIFTIPEFERSLSVILLNTQQHGGKRMGKEREEISKQKTKSGSKEKDIQGETSTQHFPQVRNLSLAKSKGKEIRKKAQEHHRRVMRQGPPSSFERACQRYSMALEARNPPPNAHTHTHPHFLTRAHSHTHSRPQNHTKITKIVREDESQPKKGHHRHQPQPPSKPRSHSHPQSHSCERTKDNASRHNQVVNQQKEKQDIFMKGNENGKKRIKGRGVRRRRGKISYEEVMKQKEKAGE